MTLADITLPISYEWGHAHALVFGAPLLARLLSVQQEWGTPNVVPGPVAMTDGRFFLHADILCECSVGGFLSLPFSKLDPSRFSEITVLGYAQALALMPPPNRDGMGP